MGGFCASTYKRGIDFINIPTTLLAQVDASIGGKLGIDFHGFKNHIGVFNEPQKVFVDPGFLETLDFRELRSGYAEVVKHSLIADRNKFDELTKIELADANWKEIIPHSISIKEKIVASDPKESGRRKILNFGHTIGHAIESYFLNKENMKLLHGEAIAIGMICETYLSGKKLNMRSDEVKKATDLIIRVFEPQRLEEGDIEQILPLAMQDKKNEAGSIKAALLKKIGDCAFDITIEKADIKEAFGYYNRAIAGD
jgi:3-dehydroquinate synthase